MSGKASRGMVWARIFIVLILVSLMAWCTTNNRRMAQSAPLRMELQSIFLEQGLIDNSNERSNLADVARKAGTARMNRLLYDVAGSASLDSLKWIVANGAEPKDIGIMRDMTLLQSVAMRAQGDRIEYFLGLGLNPAERSRDGKTLMHIAAQGGMDNKVLALLVAKGLNMNEPDNVGRVPIHYASVKAISVLAGAGADIDAKDALGMTPLHYAAKEGKNDIVAELLRNSASVYLTDKKGRTALHFSAMTAQSNNLVDTLLAAGAPVTVRDEDGNTPKDLAIEARDNYRYRNVSVIDRL